MSRRRLEERIELLEMRADRERLQRLADLGDRAAQDAVARDRYRQGDMTLMHLPKLDYTDTSLRPGSVVLYRERLTEPFKSHGSKVLGIVTSKYGDPGKPKYSVYTELGGKHRVPAAHVVSSGKLVMKQDQAIVRALHLEIADDRMFRWWR